MSERFADFVIIGSGLGAAAAARCAAAAGASVMLIPGIARTRSPHVDGGVVSPELVEQAFGAGAPIGEVTEFRQELVLDGEGSLRPGAMTAIPSYRVYRRSELELWSIERATAAGTVFLDDFIEDKALPNPDGTLTLASEHDERTIRARTIVLCEGADPRIPLRVRLRPDYGPQEQIHFARTIIRSDVVSSLREGRWRTTWGMPVGLALIPQDDGVLVSVSTRIENVMRCGRSAKDALEDFLVSPAFASLNVKGRREETGVELVALRQARQGMTLVYDRLVMGIDASGVIDPRRFNRADLTIRAGMTLGNWLVGRHGVVDGWDAAARQWIERNVPPASTYHDDKTTGFLEEYGARRTSGIPGVLARLMRVRG